MAILQFLDRDRKQRTIAVTEVPIRLGRSPDNDVVVESNFVSAFHAQIFIRNGRVLLRDLNSHNGTFINGLRVREVPLSNGDEIALADFKIKFFDSPVRPVQYYEDESELDEKRLLKTQVGEAPIVKTIMEGRRVPVVGAEKRSHMEQLLVLYRIIEKIHTAIDMREMLARIIELLMEVVPGDRGYILLDEGEDGEMVPVATAEVGRETASTSAISLSRTITRKAIHEKSAVLIQDALSAMNWNPSKSIIALNIRSAICAPLWTGEEVMGLIYMDNRQMVNTFDKSHLELLSAVGYQTALGIEKFRLTDRIREEELLRTNLQRYHSPDVIEMIMEQTRRKEAAMPNVEEREVTVLFCDIVGFTEISERLHPRDVADFLNEYLSILTEIVFEFGGTLDKYLGDGVMAVFGAPVCHGDDARRAVRAAIKMRDEVQRLMSYRQRKVTFKIRVGVNSGKVVAGNIGSHRRMEYTVLGDTVNVASRLEMTSEPGRILIGEATFEQVKEDFYLDSAGERMVKNRKAPIRCWWVLGTKSDESGTDIEEVTLPLTEHHKGS